MDQSAPLSLSHGRPASADPSATPLSSASSGAASSASAHKRNTSGGGGGGGLLSKFPFMRSTAEQRSARHDGDEDSSSHRPPASISTALQQQKTRRRRGSLRKVALLGRGAQRERREATPLTIDTRHTEEFGIMGSGITSSPQAESEVYGLGISDITPRPSMDGYASRSAQVKSPPEVPPPVSTSKVDEPIPTSPTISYSTTDDEDVLHLAPHTPSPLRPELTSLSSGSDSYFSNRMNTLQPRRSISRAKSPLALTGLATTPIPAPDPDWDYAETEWWGWVVLVVTWFVFVTGMGSCFGVWSWAWDVGTTPYAPPELEDDPTLPIVGYYPALIILTCVMAWVWVVIAWIGMKYFRHAKISGD